MGQAYLLDTTAVVDYVGGKLPRMAMQKMNQIVNAGFNISPVVKIETLGFNGPAADMQKLEALLNFATMFYIDDFIIQKSIDLRKAYKIKLGDAIIAATSLVHNLTLFSRNISDFKVIQGLEVVNPHTL